ncbi:hypothetical protein PPNK14_39840 [Pectobacterium parmentieri]
MPDANYCPKANYSTNAYADESAVAESICAPHCGRNKDMSEMRQTPTTIYSA